MQKNGQENYKMKAKFITSLSISKTNGTSVNKNDS